VHYSRKEVIGQSLSPAQGSCKSSHKKGSHLFYGRALDFRHSQVLASKASREQSSSRLPQESICFAAFDLVNLYTKASGYPRADQSMQQRPAQAATQDPGQAPKGSM